MVSPITGAESYVCETAKSMKAVDMKAVDMKAVELAIAQANRSCKIALPNAAPRAAGRAGATKVKTGGPGGSRIFPERYRQMFIFSRDVRPVI
jgi:hypothetical protein